MEFEFGAFQAAYPCGCLGQENRCQQKRQEYVSQTFHKNRALLECVRDTGADNERGKLKIYVRGVAGVAYRFVRAPAAGRHKGVVQSDMAEQMPAETVLHPDAAAQIEVACKGTFQNGAYDVSYRLGGIDGIQFWGTHQRKACLDTGREVKPVNA